MNLYCDILLTLSQVNGPGADPLYDYLRKETGGGDISWNFGKGRALRSQTRFPKKKTCVAPGEQPPPPAMSRYLEVNNL